MLLVAAQVLAARRVSFGGSVKLCFQPAEEFGGGAQYMLEQLSDVDQVYGIHLMTSLTTGTDAKCLLPTCLWEQSFSV